MQSKVERCANEYWWIILLILLIPSVWALTYPGFYGASDDLHIAWLDQMDKVIRIGQIPPRFVPDLSFGFGYPLFNFVFPLPFYIAEIFHLLGLNLVNSIKITLGLSLVASAFAMFLLVKEFTNKWVSMVAALLYVYTPYRSVDVYVRGAVGEAFSFIFLPLATLAVVKLTDRSNWRWIGIGALSLAGLVLSHNITTYMFFPILLTLVLIRLIIFKKGFLQILLMFGLGLLSSIYFWLPALLDSKLMKYDTVFNFADHFPTLRQLFLPYWGYGGSVPGPGDGMSFFIGLINILILTVGTTLLIIYWKRLNFGERSFFVWGLISFILALFMMNFRSAPVWQTTPFLPYFQFPWRFLILTTFITPIFLIALSKLSIKKFLVPILLGLIVLLNFSIFRPEHFLGRTDEYYLNRYIPNPSASEEYKLTQEEYLRLPLTTEKRPDMKYPLIFGDFDQSAVNVEKLNDLSIVAETSSETPILLNYSKYFFPGWFAEIDGREANIFAGKPFGQVSINIPEGRHLLKISFRETSLKTLLDLISFVALVVSLILILRYGQR